MGFCFFPPAYPTRVLTTPARLPNRESGPQNQPIAKVAVAICFGELVSIRGFEELGEEAKALGLIACCPLSIVK
ncbi:MAG TPA: hypothetical protein VLG72_06430 [Nitrospirota bacterium]|nr:hypothetical protein [Nitrospirota bacterium]